MLKQVMVTWYILMLKIAILYSSLSKASDVFHDILVR